MWKTSGDENGVWLGILTHKEATTGFHGIWLLQNQLSGEPGYTDKLMYKSWGSGQKYLGAGHSPLLPAHGGRLEGVMVMHGCLACDVTDHVRILSYPQSIELEANIPRTWKLPDDCGEDEIEMTRGIAIARHQPKSHALQFGEGENYNLNIFDCEQYEDSFDNILLPPINQKMDWEWLMIEIFAGVACLRNVEAKKEYWIGAGHHIFLPRDFFTDLVAEWTCESQRVRGVAIHY
jgi:hypothetical protein